MEKFPFTPQGVQDLLTQLYALTDPQLELEAASLQADLPAWLRAKFDLTTHQETYLDNLGATFINFSATRSSFALANRLPIELIVPEAARGQQEQEKIIKSSDKTSLDSNDEPSGSLTFEVEFQ